MPKSRTDEFINQRKEDLLKELETLRRALLLKSSSDRDQARGDTILALARLYKNISPDEWKNIADELGLKHWISLTLNSDKHQNLLQLQTLLEELSHESEHDALTGLPNRRMFIRILDMEIQRTHRSNTPLSLAILDLDDFKAVNDAHGHPCGDSVLQGFAEVLKDSIRSYDLAARLGGEEFAVLLPGTGLYKSQTVCERLLENVAKREHYCDHGLKPIRVTCSIGLACYRGRVKYASEKFMDLADAALYEAKNKGRNRLVSAPIPDLTPFKDTTLVKSREKRFLFTGDDKPKE